MQLIFFVVKIVFVAATAIAAVPVIVVAAPVLWVLGRGGVR